MYYVCKGFMIEINGFTHILHAFWHMSLIMSVSVMEVEDWEDRRLQYAIENEPIQIEDG